MNRRSLLFKLLALAGAAAVVPALIITLVQRSISSHALENSIRRHQTELARRTANEINGEIYAAQRMLAYAAPDPVWRAGSAAEQRRSLAKLLKSVPSFQEVMLVDAIGQERINLNRNGTSSPKTKRPAGLEESFIGTPFFSGGGLPTILLGEPLRLNGRSSGALMAKMSFSELSSLMVQAHIGGHGMAFIVDQQGDLIAHPDEERVLAHANFADLPVVKEWRTRPNEPSALKEYPDERGVPAIAVACPIPLLHSAVVVQQPRAEVYEPLIRLRDDSILCLCIGLFIFISLALAVAWRILQPLRQLEGAAEAIGRGNLDVDLDIKTGDELEDLGKAFNQMADSLRALETMRTDLINMIIHDLKSPLSTILASLDYLISGELGTLTEEQMKFLNMSRRASQDLLGMIQTLLDIAKMDEGKLVLEKESFAPLPWAEKVVQSFQPSAEIAQKKLVLESPNALSAAEGDVALLSRVLGNLISNALQHTRMKTGAVTVILNSDDGLLRVDVQDNGEGIPLEHQSAIFEKFVQVDGGQKRVRRGTGLGLTFCKMVVEAHGGVIAVHSTPQQGSTFTFTLPLA